MCTSAFAANGGGVIRNAEHTVVCVDERLDDAGRMEVLRELLTEAELAEWLREQE